MNREKIMIVLDEAEMLVKVQEQTKSFKKVYDSLRPIEKVYHHPSELKIEIYYDLVEKFVHAPHSYGVVNWGVYSNNQYMFTFGIVIEELTEYSLDYYLLLITPTKEKLFRLVL